MRYMKIPEFGSLRFLSTVRKIVLFVYKNKSYMELAHHHPLNVMVYDSMTDAIKSMQKLESEGYFVFIYIGSFYQESENEEVEGVLIPNRIIDVILYFLFLIFPVLFIFYWVRYHG